jgi:hypothetical protein
VSADLQPHNADKDNVLGTHCKKNAKKLDNSPTRYQTPMVCRIVYACLAFLFCRIRVLRRVNSSRIRWILSPFFLWPDKGETISSSPQMTSPTPTWMQLATVWAP